MNVFRTLGRIVTAPVRVPIEKGQQMATRLVILALIRNGLKLAGLAGVFSDSQLNEGVGALMLLGGLAWTGVNTWRELRAAKTLPPA